MAVAAATVWEIRSDGSDNNAGAYLAGATGTDRTQQAAAFASGTNLTVDAVTNTDVAPDGYTPVSADIGNYIQVTAGVGFTTGFYRIASIQSGKWRLDASPAATGTSGGTWAMGGALATINKLATSMVAGNKAYATGAFTTTATITFAQSQAIPTGSSPPTRLIGYGSARGDSGHATLTLQTNTGLTGIVASGSGFFCENIDVDCAGLATSTGFSTSGTYSQIRYCKAANFTLRGFNLAGANHTAYNLEATGGTSAATAGISVGTISTPLTRCHVHDNACPGIILADGQHVLDCLAANNTGASSDGIRLGFGCSAINNTCHGNGRDGIRHGSANLISNHWRNNLLTSNGGYGITGSSGTALPADPTYDGNTYWNNTSGARNLMDNTAGVFGLNPYANTRDVTLSASPYVGPTSGATANFGLNATAGGGAAARGAGAPGAFPGLATTVGYPDMGAVQHADSAAGAKNPLAPGIIIALRGVA